MPTITLAAQRAAVVLPQHVVRKSLPASVDIPRYLISKTARCPLPAGGKRYRVAFVNDGDTITLQSGYRVRLIGINSPEVDHRKLSASQPGGVDAWRMVQSLLKTGDRVRLLPGVKKEDRYGRLLAQVELENGTNLAALLLLSGGAQQVIYPPNDSNWRCYQKLEQEARARHLGLWAYFRYWPRVTDFVGTLDAGYVRLVGTITSVKRTHRYYWMVLDHKIYLGIKLSDIAKFGDAFVMQMFHHRVEVRGWLYFSHGFMRIRLRHPQQLVWSGLSLGPKKHGASALQ